MNDSYRVLPLAALLGVALLAGIADAATARDAAAEQPCYHTFQQLSGWTDRLVREHPGVCKAVSIGVSREGRGLIALELAIRSEIAPDRRPAILIVATIGGDHLVGGEVAMEIVDRLLDMTGAGDESAIEFLTDHALYVIPRVNPDAAESYFDDVASARRRNLRPDDADRDGLIDEDPPNDINGDGLVTMMRVFDADDATLMPDPDEPRLDRKADRDMGERPLYKLVIEGVDDDGDGELNEDGVGGVDLNRNFMHGYEEHVDGTGPHQVSEPESLALLKYVLDHQNIAVVLTYGRHDNLSRTPDGKGKNAAGAPKNIDEKDVGAYRYIGNRFREMTGLEDAPRDSGDGAFFAWAYAQFGVPSFATPLWTGAQPGKNERDKEGSPKQDGDRSDGGESGEEAAWLLYSDEQRDGEGFVDWTPFEHPELGTVEIGGWAPFFKTNPPADAIDGIAGKQLEFVLDLAVRLPDITLTEPEITKLASGLYRVKMALENNGFLPTGTAMAVRNRRARPHVVRLSVPVEQVISGRPVHKVWSIPGSGGRESLNWMVKAPDNSMLTVTVYSEKYGEFKVTFPLADNQDNGGES